MGLEQFGRTYRNKDRAERAQQLAFAHLASLSPEERNKATNQEQSLRFYGGQYHPGRLLADSAGTISHTERAEVPEVAAGSVSALIVLALVFLGALYLIHCFFRRHHAEPSKTRRMGIRKKKPIYPSLRNT